MAVSLEHWTRVCPAPTTGSSLCSPLHGSPLYPSRSISIRLPPKPSSCGRDSKRGRAIVMQFEAADGRPSAGTDQLKVREDTSFFNSLQVDPAVTNRPNLGGAKEQRNIVIPCLFMRGGTSRGTFFLKQHLPQDKAALNKVLLRVMGSPDPGQIDGLGGAKSVTSKVAILSGSTDPDVDVDYTFAQVSIDRPYVDWEPSCGNMLAGVGPAAIEMGLVTRVGKSVTPVRIRATNNGVLVEAVVQTPNGAITYDGDAVIDGVPGTAAPITLNFMNVVGSKTGGRMLPTGQVRDVIDGVEVTCIDVAMPVVIARASSFGKSGYESPEELDRDVEFFRKLEAVRVIAGSKMGLGDVTGRVLPKFAIVAEPRDPAGNITARYFDPFRTHAAMAVTGGICIGCCSILQGSVADGLSTKSTIGKNHNRVVIEHPTGQIQLFLDSEQQVETSTMIVNRAGVMRTARLIFEGSVHIKLDGLENVALQDQSVQELERYRQYYHQLQQDFRKLYRFNGSSKGVDLEGRR
ncbi:unnamed protein product [Calypogeia fissa]